MKDTNRKVRNDLKIAINAIEKWDDDHKQLWENVRLFSNSFGNPFREEANAAHAEIGILAAQLADRVEKADLAGVKSSTIVRICGKHLRRFNLDFWPNSRFRIRDE